VTDAPVLRAGKGEGQRTGDQDLAVPRDTDLASTADWLKTTTSAENPPFSGDFAVATKPARRCIYMRAMKLADT
jgi:hypothetical protein